MCKYCESKRKVPIESMDNIPIKYTNSQKIEGEEGPMQYIKRHYRSYFLVTEIGTCISPIEESIIQCKILFCPFCGRKLT